MNMLAPRRRRLVLVGNGMAGIRTLEEILARAPDAFAITVFGAEPHGNYNRIMLSPVLAGEKRFDDETVPAGTPAVEYQVTAVRSTRRGQPARHLVNFGVAARRAA